MFKDESAVVTYAAMALLLAALMAGCTPARQEKPVATAQAGDPGIAGVVAGPAGRQLSAVDRDIAGRMQLAAIREGVRKSWKGKGPTFGYILPGPVVQGLRGNCRDYSHTIYFNGRPTTGKGSACEAEPGRWIIS